MRHGPAQCRRGASREGGRRAGDVVAADRRRVRALRRSYTMRHGPAQCRSGASRESGRRAGDVVAGDRRRACRGRAGLSRVGLLGTRFTMEQAFHRGRLAERHGIEVLVPEPDDRDRVHRVIYEELCLGRVEDTSRAAYREVMRRLFERGAQGIALGCTEIALLVAAQDASVPLFDTTAIHAGAAVEFALGKG
jgi:hypothetical protein